MDAMRKRLVTTAAALWAVWLLLTWITSTWKDMTDLGRTEVVLLGALAQLLFWVGWCASGGPSERRCCAAWAARRSRTRPSSRQTSPPPPIRAEHWPPEGPQAVGSGRGCSEPVTSRTSSSPRPGRRSL